MNLPNNLLGLLNILTFLISIPIVVVGVQMNRVSGAGECFELFRKPVLILGVLIMVMSIVGIIGACCRVSWVLWIYLFGMLLLIISLFVVYGIALIVTWKSGGGTRLPGTELKEYKLSSYSDWLQNRVQGKSWDTVKNCLVVGDGCSEMPKNDTTLKEFNMKELNPVMVYILEYLHFFFPGLSLFLDCWHVIGVSTSLKSSYKLLIRRRDYVK